MFLFRHFYGLLSLGVDALLQFAIFVGLNFMADYEIFVLHVICGAKPRLIFNFILCYRQCVRVICFLCHWHCANFSYGAKI